jgi:nitrate reductase assembly molybdenum cofactor insertion protein NarJ
VEQRSHYRVLAALLEYPGAEYPQRVQQIRDSLEGLYPEACAELDRFLQLLPADNLTTMQELYTRSFDVQAMTTLDVGYVLFGDDYKRGVLLANLNSEYRAADLDTGTELADHIPNLLRLMELLEDEEVLHDLAYAILAPALLEMIREFSSDRIEKRNASYKKHYKTLIETPAVKINAFTLYQHALQALYEVLKQDFSLIEEIPLKRTCDFLESVDRENEIEERAGAH